VSSYTDSGIAQGNSAGLATVRTWVQIPTLAGSCRDCRLLIVILAQNKNNHHYEVERGYSPTLGAPYFAAIGRKTSVYHGSIRHNVSEVVPTKSVQILSFGHLYSLKSNGN